MDCPTSCVTFVETEHGRSRRRQRGIDKKDLKAAMKKGKREKYYRQTNGDPAAKYTYKDIVYIVNERTKKEITSYARPLRLDKVPVTPKMIQEHQQACENIKTSRQNWKSHTVLVVDTSGSMKEADIWGAPSRLGAVWLSMALDYLAHRLETGAAGTADVISIVILGEPAEVLMEERPSTWVLYNQLACIYQTQQFRQSKILPKGHGPFLPALKKAESLLMRSTHDACVMGLIFLSDGVPSDPYTVKSTHNNQIQMTFEDCVNKIVKRIENLAKRLGRQFTLSAVGIGEKEDFAVLRRMVDAAKDYGSTAALQLPSMTSSALGTAFTTFASSVTSTQAEMTDVETKQQRPVRRVIRESRSKASEALTEVSQEDFFIYSLDQVQRTVYREWYDEEEKKKKRGFDEAPLQHPDARFVALSKKPFGEGGERFAYRFFEIAADGKTIVGKPLVAKESRHVLTKHDGDEDARKRFVRTFCSTQQLARRLAEEFNEKLRDTHRADAKTPKVSFLDCCVYQLTDQKLGKLSVLVEEKLDHHQWHKWNANNGYVEGMNGAPEISQERIREAVQGLSHVGLDIIEEGSDDSDSEGGRSETDRSRVLFTPSQVAQAFSHFTYRASGRKRLVCDLQGVFDEKENILKFSDPVIHYYNAYRSDRRFVHGKTDRGGKGVAMFFETHHSTNSCGYLCRLMLRGFQRLPQHHRALHQQQNGGDE